MHAADVLQAGFELHGRESPGREDPLPPFDIVAALQILLDLLTTVGLIIDIDVGQHAAGTLQVALVCLRIESFDRSFFVCDLRYSHDCRSISNSKSRLSNKMSSPSRSSSA